MWYTVQNSDRIASPALIVDKNRVRQNIAQMIALAQGPERLCPHVKTHKMLDVTRLYLEAGVQAFKCATIAEAEMLGQAGARFALLAYQPVGPNVGRLIQLIATYPGTRFATIVDCPEVLERLSAEVARLPGAEVEVYLDVDVGMHRTGIEVGVAAAELYRRICDLPAIVAGGLHVYDGHIHDVDVGERTRRVEQAFQGVDEFVGVLRADNLPVPRVVAGGSPSFPIHVKTPDRWCSPGTGVFWDAGYGRICPDLGFQPAAWLISRVISKPGTDRVCLDLGYKAIASENPPPRAMFPAWPHAIEAGHSEEHLVLQMPQASELSVGDVVYAVPRHICPTVSLYQHAYVVEEGRWIETWEVTARNRILTI